MSSVNIGLDENARKSVAEALNQTLADTYALYIRPTPITGTSPARSFTPCM